MGEEENLGMGGVGCVRLRDRCKLKKRKARGGGLAFLEGLSNLLGGLPEMRRHA